MCSTTWLITEANRGMGLEWVVQVLALGDTAVVAAGRPVDEFQELERLSDMHKGRLTILKMELLQKDSIEAAASEVKRLHPKGIDYLINNAGILGKYSTTQHLNLQEFMQVLLTNTHSAFSITNAFLPSLKAGQKKIIVHIKSNAASVSSTELPVNAETTIFSNLLKHEGFTVVSLDPGDISTGMWAYLKRQVFTEDSRFAKGGPLLPATSIRAMLRLTLNLAPHQTGKFIQYNGTVLSW